MKTKPVDVRHRGPGTSASGGGGVSGGANNNNKNDVTVQVTKCTATIEQEIESLPLVSKNECIKVSCMTLVCGASVKQMLCVHS